MTDNNTVLAQNGMLPDGKQLILHSRAKWRYIRLQIDEIFGKEAGGYLIQISRLEFADSNGSYFSYPTDVTASLHLWSNASAAQTPLKMLDHSTSTKWCANHNGSSAITTGSYVQLDLGSNCLDTSIYSKWQWWTADDTSMYSNRNMKSFKLLLSVDGSSWHLADECLAMPQVAKNNVLAYEGQLK